MVEPGDGMRIAYVINSVEGGGAAFPVPAVCRVLTGLGAAVEVFALTRRNGRAVAAMQAAGLRVHIRDGGETDHLAAARWLDHQMTGFSPDVIWTSLTRATLLGQLVGRRRRVPVASWQHNAFLKPANEMLLRATRRLTAIWIADSRSVAALTADRLAIPPERLAVWPLFAVNDTAPQSAPWHPGETLKLGSLGRLHVAKGYDILIQALARLRANGFRSPTPFEIRIAGEGTQRSGLEAALRASDIQSVKLCGFAEDPMAFLADLHVYVQPSRREGLCIAMHEAMQAGLPVLVSAVGEMPFTVEDGVSGYVVPPEDPDGPATALAGLLSNPGRLAGIGASARQRVRDQFSVAAFESAGAGILARLRPGSSRQLSG